MSVMEMINQYWQQQFYLKPHPLQKKLNLHKKHGKKVEQIAVNGKLLNRQQNRNNDIEVVYRLHLKCFIDDQQDYYHEEEIEIRKAILTDDKVIDDRLEPLPVEERSVKQQMLDVYQRERFNYDRRAAVQYAERWWDDYNPKYKVFYENDCTNYISQCLHAGGAPMRGAPNRSKGWWYSGDSWSYSWSVAHTFRWYLSGSTIGLKGTEVENPEDLMPGDVICYDFQGDGRFDHTTIVVTKDSQGMPLVNAHTNNSRHRYWTYEDSAAWTNDCEYRFFHIG
ncbi:amidase domain-containing protein [Gracilibacillus sp. YIM 98692]|uniref:amidase domain-containing protein n=1 Tax=Gracilibacillus sp. YIM 98692 TaxID=2663532 RepID=UPI0013D07A94|nr:amidase domain-containing protein [Gracilibacillus sp. YIM 98692]